ncbi:MAG TPA: outer membrane beta-barrel protein [Sphingomonas sp.]|nr:outer membrane beta-barrel protein [Sphingomonas sp.]
MKTLLLATGALLAASAAPALAQDAAPAAPSEGATFTGPRAEIFGGWDRVGTRTRVGDITTKGHDSAWTAGGLLGYDVPIGNRFTVGAFGSYAISTAKQCYGTATGSGCLKAGREIEGGARVGARLGGKALVYLKGAYVNGQLRNTYGDGTTYIRDHVNRDGWRAGAGVEYALTNHAYVKAEYDYTRFNRFNADDLGMANTSLRFDRNQVLAGFGVHF